jgi:hypothetical protein
MSNAPGVVAKAFLDALPSLDFNKMVGEARREFGIAFVGDQQVVEQLLRHLREPSDVPSDVKLALWRHVPGESAPLPAGKTELVIVAPATEEHLNAARGAFAGVSILPIVFQDTATTENPTNTLKLESADADQVHDVLIPELVERMWERRLAIGRGIPSSRDHVAWQLTLRAAKDVKALLGSVAGAGGGRSGAPTPATAQLLMHQAVLIVSIAAVYGAVLDDRRAIFTRVAPSLAPTLLLDGAEAGISRLAAAAGGNRKFGSLYGPLAAYVTRPTLTVSSTFVAGLTARRAFRPHSDVPSLAERTRELGKRMVIGAGQGAAVVGTVLGARLRSRGHGSTSSSDTTEGKAPEPPRSDPPGDARTDA